MISSLADLRIDNSGVFADAELISFSTFQQDSTTTQNATDNHSISFVGMRVGDVVLNNFETQVFKKIKDLVLENKNLKTVMQKNNQRLEDHYKKCVEFKEKYINRENDLKEKLLDKQKNFEELEWKFESYKKIVSSNNFSLVPNQTDIQNVIENEKKNFIKVLESIDEQKLEESVVKATNEALEVLQSFSSSNSSDLIMINDVVSKISSIQGSLIDNTSSNSCQVKDLLSNAINSIQFLNPQQGTQPISLEHYYDLNTCYDALLMENKQIKLEYEELCDSNTDLLKVAEEFYTLKKEHSEILAELKNKEVELFALKSQVDDRSVIIEPFNGEELNELKNEIKQLNNKVKELEMENVETSKSFAAVDEENCQLNDENERLKEENEQLKVENKQLKVENRQLKFDNDQLKVENKQLKFENEPLKIENKAYSTQINEMKELIKQLQEIHQQDKTTSFHLRNNQKSYDTLVFKNKQKETNGTQLNTNYINSLQGENQMMSRLSELEEMYQQLECQLDEKTKECLSAKNEAEFKHKQLLEFNNRMQDVNANFHATNLLNQKLTSKVERFNELEEFCAKLKYIAEEKTKEAEYLKNHLMGLNVANENLKKQCEELWRNLNLKSQQLKEKEQVENIIREKDNEICTLKENMDILNDTIQKMSADVESIPVYQTQMDAYENDFRAERAAREKIHQELGRVSEQLNERVIENARLREEIKDLASNALSDVQQRYNNPSMIGRFNQSSQQFHNYERPLPSPRSGSNPRPFETNQSHYNDDSNSWNRVSYHSEERKCPKCMRGFPDLDGLQLHVVECLDD